MHKMILKQHTQLSTKDYAPDGPISKNSTRHEWFMWTTGKCHQRSNDFRFLVGWEVNDAERQILALPLRHGGLGLTNPQETTKTEYHYSTQITAKLRDKIYNQKLDLDHNPSDQQYIRHMKNIQQEKNAKCQNSCDKLSEEMTLETVYPTLIRKIFAVNIIAIGPCPHLLNIIWWHHASGWT